MRGFVLLWLSQLWKLLVLWPAWLLTPEGCKAVFNRSNWWRIALALVFAVALVGFLQIAMPADVALFAAGDVVAYIDVAVIAWVAGAGSVLKAAAAWLTRRSQRPAQLAARRGRRAATRRHGPRRPRPPANDDHPGERWAIAV